jgi:alcohol dehydrogenase (cytochrome c)
MAEAHNTLFVPWLDLCFKGSATSASIPVPPQAGGLVAVNAATGAVVWKHRFPLPDFGGATVANDVVFTSTYDGTVYALSAGKGSVLWSSQAPTGINSFPAVTKRMLIVGAGLPAKAKSHRYAVVAYSLP